MSRPPGTILTWDNHCWVRLRSTMSLLEQQLARIRRAVAGKEGTRSYADLEEGPPSYRFEDPAAAAEMLDGLEGLADAWSARPRGALGESSPAFAGASDPAPGLTKRRHTHATP